MARDYLTYTYDASGRRIGAGGSLAQVSLPTAQTFQIGPGNRVIQANGQSLSYDVSGNLLTDGTNTYTWNARNQLTGITGANSGSFAYDAFGRRMNKTIAGQATSYLHDGDNPFTMTTSGATGTQLSAGTDQWLSTTIDGTPKYYISDALGSVVALVDASGNMVTQYSYEAYGATTQTGAISANPFQYTGRENDGTGLYYYRARYYNPTLMRFLSEDPIGLAGGINNYTYVGGNPVSYTDPFGLMTVVPGGFPREEEMLRQMGENIQNKINRLCPKAKNELQPIFDRWEVRVDPKINSIDHNRSDYAFTDYGNQSTLFFSGFFQLQPILRQGGEPGQSFVGGHEFRHLMDANNRLSPGASAYLKALFEGKASQLAIEKDADSFSSRLTNGDCSCGD